MCKLEDSEIDKMKMNQLKEELRSRGFKVTGKVEPLRQRLKDRKRSDLSKTTKLEEQNLKSEKPHFFVKVKEDYLKDSAGCYAFVYKRGIHEPVYYTRKWKPTPEVSSKKRKAERRANKKSKRQKETNTDTDIHMAEKKTKKIRKEKVKMQKEADQKDTDTKAELKGLVPRVGQLPMGDAEIKALVTAGADFKDGGGEVALVSFAAGSNAHKEYVKVASTLDPFVLAAWIGPINGVIPPLAQAGPLCHEANAIIHAYQPLLAAAFFPGAPLPLVPVIPGVLLGPAWYHHAQIACTKVVERVQNPGPGFPSINALGGGTYVCSIQYTHANCIVVIAIYKA